MSLSWSIEEIESALAGSGVLSIEPNGTMFVAVRDPAIPHGFRIDVVLAGASSACGCSFSPHDVDLYDENADRDDSY